MRVLICYKWERDSGEATISSDGSLKWFNTELKPSDDDAAAITFARQIAFDTDGSLTAVTIGDGDATWALARGASRAVRADKYMPGKDDAETAAQLARAIKAVGEYDVVLMGDAQEFAGVVPITAALLGLPLIAGVSDVSADTDIPDCLNAHRVTTQAKETLRIRMPAMISVMASTSEKKQPTMRQIMASKRLPVDTIDTAELEPVGSNRITVKSVRLPSKREVKLFEGDSAQMVAELVTALRTNGVL